VAFFLQTADRYCQILTTRASEAVGGQPTLGSYNDFVRLIVNVAATDRGDKASVVMLLSTRASIRRIVLVLTVLPPA
jgi:hypothetical protein